MAAKTTVLIDFEEAFKSHTGIPMSTVNDALSIICCQVDVILWYSHSARTHQIQEWIEQVLTEKQRSHVRLLSTRPSNKIMWLKQLVPKFFEQNIACNFAYSRLFPFLPIRGNHMTLLRIDDPFGSKPSFFSNFRNDFANGNGLKNSLARSLRTQGFRNLSKHKTIKIFNSAYTCNTWNNIYGNVTEADKIIYPPVQFSVDDYFTNPKVPQVKPKSRPYFIFVGGQRQRKDPMSIVNLWAETFPSKLYDFVIVGAVPSKLLNQNVIQAMQAGRLRIVQNISSEELRNLILNSRALIFNSKGEGFGNPIAEAIYLGIDVVCNDLEVFREVAGMHAQYFKSGNNNEAISILDSLAKFKAKKSKFRFTQYSFGYAIHLWKILLCEN